MIRFTDGIEIAAAPARVFGFVADLDNLPKFQSDVVRSTVIDPGPVRVGTRFEEVVKVGPFRPLARCVVTELEPDRLMGFRADSKGIHYEGRFVIEPAGGGSRVTSEGTIELRGPWRLFERVLARDVRAGLRRELEAIKQLTEAP